MNDITKIKVDGDPESSYQLYPRNEEFSKRVELEIKEHAGSNVGGGIQSDWNVTDSADPAFIKNRPFGQNRGKKIVHEYYTESSNQNENGDYVFTITSSNDYSLATSSDDSSKAYADVTINNVTYENVEVNVQEYSSSSAYTFATDELPFSLSIAVYDGGASSTITLTYGQSYFEKLIIFDRNCGWDSKMDLEYLGVSRYGGISDKRHLNYSTVNNRWEASYDLYTMGSDSHVYKINVDAEGNLSTTKVT